jgi:hypothetical protein
MNERSFSSRRLLGQGNRGRALTELGVRRRTEGPIPHLAGVMGPSVRPVGTGYFFFAAGFFAAGLAAGFLAAGFFAAGFFAAIYGPSLFRFDRS